MQQLKNTLPIMVCKEALNKLCQQLYSLPLPRSSARSSATSAESSCTAAHRSGTSFEWSTKRPLPAEPRIASGTTCSSSSARKPVLFVECGSAAKTNSRACLRYTPKIYGLKTKTHPSSGRTLTVHLALEPARRRPAWTRRQPAVNGPLQ